MKPIRFQIHVFKFSDFEFKVPFLLKWPQIEIPKLYSSMRFNIYNWFVRPFKFVRTLSGNDTRSNGPEEKWEFVFWFVFLSCSCQHVGFEFSRSKTNLGVCLTRNKKKVAFFHKFERLRRTISSFSNECRQKFDRVLLSQTI